MITVTTCVSPRPARPRIPAQRLLDRATAAGYAPREIATLTETDEGDLIVRSTNGGETILVDPANPDGAGQSGTLCYTPIPGRTRFNNPSRLKWFVPRNVSQAWTVADLEWEACKVHPPQSPSGGSDGWGGYSGWLFDGSDTEPVRAYALMKLMAKQRRLDSPRSLAASSELGRKLRDLIASSQWLDPVELASIL
ncbi:MAG TPA: hypothetical protein VIS06_18425 [Mycobacteriales bacterium]|jgi:hypothetical protein